MLMPVAFTFAHCPLCTAGAGVGALIAKELGMKSSAIGVWIGAFSVALGWWLGRIISSRLGSHIVPEYKPNNLPESKPNNIPELKPNSFGNNLDNTFEPNSGNVFDNNSGNVFRSNSGDNNSVKIRAVNSVVIRIIYNFSKPLSILISFLSIILPLKLYFYEIGSLSIFWFGDYGSLFNRTYVYDKFLFGSIIGGLVILISPLISKKIIELRRGKIFPYQGLLITFLLLIIISVLFQIKI